MLRSRSVDSISFDLLMISIFSKDSLAVLTIINSSSVRMTRAAHETLKVFISVISQMSHASIVSTLGCAVRSTVIAAWLYLRKNCETQLSGIPARFYNARRYN
jgi:hypothetical protein